MNKVAAIEMAKTIKIQFDLGNETGNEHMRNRALARYEVLIERIGFDPLA
jgi:hypothetical protein